MITVCIIEDLLEIQKGLQAIIESDSRFKILKCFDNGEDAIAELPIAYARIPKYWRI